jgi:hypothetical protein
MIALAFAAFLLSHSAPADGPGQTPCWQWQKLRCCSLGWHNTPKVECVDDEENEWTCLSWYFSEKDHPAGTWYLTGGSGWRVDAQPTPPSVECEFRKPVCGNLWGACLMGDWDSFGCADYPEPIIPQNCP